MHQPHSADDTLVRSYLVVRKSIRVVGMALPIVFVLGGLALGTGLQRPLSAYYQTALGNIFVGSLCPSAVFGSYRGHDDRDDHAGNIPSLAALCVARMPTASARPRNTA